MCSKDDDAIGDNREQSLSLLVTPIQLSVYARSDKVC
jgi:hypothetical protein